MRARWLGPAVVVALLVFTALAWPHLPARMVVHWGPAGQPDGWGSRWTGALLCPVLAAGIWLLLVGLRRIDPRRANYERFEGTYWLVVNLVVLLLAVVQVAVVGPKVRSNWWMGIRTPWTLSSERVWRDTHRLGGRTFVVGGLLTVGAVFLPARAASWVMLGALVLAAAVPVAYSYVRWRQEVGPGAP
jgi:uncharacterized membrane protein